MNRFLPFNGTNETISAHYLPDEVFVLLQDGVGLYDGKEKSPMHFEGRLHLTSHRLFYLDAAKPHAASLVLQLSTVRQTEYWAGFLKSSAKITLYFSEPSSDQSPSAGSSSDAAATTVKDDDAAAPSARNWVCRVCGMTNSLSVNKCALCGVTMDQNFSSTSRSSTPSITRPSSPASITPSSPPPPPPVPPRPVVPLKPVVPRGDPTDNRIPCPVCTFLNHPSMSACEVCDSPLTNSLPIPTLAALSAASSSSSPRAQTPPPSAPLAPYVRLSFRKGGEKQFYSSLKETLEAKAWDLDRQASSLLKARLGQNSSGSGGIDAIMRNINLEARSREGDMDAALRDLDALMKNAQEMVTLAKSLNERLVAQEAAAAVSSATAAPTTTQKNLVRSSLQSLGLPSAVTPDMVRESELYHEQLAKELAGILWKKSANGSPAPMERGVMGLDEVWCLWNRARGVALVSPQDLTLTTPYLARQSPRIYFRRFPSGLTVLHTSRFALNSFIARTLDLLDYRQALSASYEPQLPESGTRIEREGLATVDIAREEGMALTLVKEMCEEAEAKGSIVRDEQGDGIRWYRNYFVTSLR